ncbi:fungal-specific transcription factor domain-containing protein [Mycena amicta]|nr:fungal-specific transcription factor domain-containing protein [Mycena amicta]
MAKLIGSVSSISLKHRGSLALSHARSSQMKFFRCGFQTNHPRPASAPTPAGGGGRGLSPPPVGTAHDLALFFVILCFGALGDTSMPFPTASPETSSSADDLRPDSRGGRDSGHYYRLTKASLTLEPVLEGPPSVATVQTLALMAIYEGLRAGENSIESTWAIFGLSTKLAQSIGLHRDCARWGLKPAEVQKRRALFWELFITDCWQALATGRLPTFSLPFVDCELPQDVDETMADDGKPQSSFPYWKARFGAECVSAVVQGTLTSRAPRYSIILELDRKVRDMEFPKYATGTPPEGVGLSQTMSHFMPTNYRHLTLLYIHRCFFAHAIQNHPNDPIKSPYAPSFLAGYRSACDLLSSLRLQFNTFPTEIARYWVLWTHAFSSAIMLSSVVTHATRSKVARAALLELGKACELFEAASQLCPGSRASKFLPILQRVSKRAVAVFEDACNGVPATIPNNIFEPSKPDAPNDELSIFSGKTHTLTTTKKKSPQAQNAPSPPSSRTMSDSPTQMLTDNPSFAGVHPSLVKELNVFDGTLNAQIQNGYNSNGIYPQPVFSGQDQYQSSYPHQQQVLREQEEYRRQQQNEEMRYHQQHQQQQNRHSGEYPYRPSSHSGYDSYVASRISPSPSQGPPLMHSTSQRSLRQSYHTPPQQMAHVHSQQDVPMPPIRSLSHSQSHRSLRQASYDSPRSEEHQFSAYNIKHQVQSPTMTESGSSSTMTSPTSVDAVYMDESTPYQAPHYWTGAGSGYPQGQPEQQQPRAAYDSHSQHRTHMHQHQQQLRQINLQLDPPYDHHYTPDGAMRGIAAEDPRLQEHWQMYMSKVGSPRMIQDP